MDDEEHPVIGFGIDYGKELIYCETIMQHDHYEVRFNGVWVGTVEATEDFGWIQASGTILTQCIVNEIGFKIESHYK
jgi:hypothetical protein